jgi:hypothetical protein
VDNLQLQQFLADNDHMFSKGMDDLGKTTIDQHQIITENVPPIHQKAYRMSPAEHEFIQQELHLMLENGLISPSKSPWSSPVVLVKKKNGKLRLCIDYRKLNKITKRDVYPLPRIDEILDTLKGAKWFSTLDLASGYWQVEMKPEDREKTAFITKYGLFEFNVMPFGLTNASATFQRVMDKIFADLKNKFILVYLDDITIYSKTFEEHLEHLKEVFKRLQNAGLKLGKDKCCFGKQQLAFLGHIISEKGILPDPSKIDKVQNYPAPTNLTELRGFIGLASYYRRFILNFSRIVEPLNKLLKKDTPFIWSETCQQAMDILKEKLTTAPILQYPDFEKLFTLFTDAFYQDLGAILAQKDSNNNEYVVAYASRALNSAEINYSPTEIECLAAVWGMEYF